jgi:hypothetical protein
MGKYLLFSILVFLFLFSKTFSQVPNGGFEQWTNGEPDGWWTSNSTGIITISQTSDSHSGSSALKGEATFNNNLLVYAIIISGEIGKKGFPVSKKYASVNGYYKLTSVDGDKISVLASMYAKGTFLGVGGLEFPAAQSYTNFIVPIYYNKLTDIPDSCQITVTIGNDTAKVHLGSAFFIDDVSLGGDVTSVNDVSKIATFKLEQNFPNPFNPSTNISWQTPIAGIQTLKVYDILGNEIATLLNEYRSAGNHQVEFNTSIKGKNLSSGIYFYQSVHSFEQRKWF